MSPPGSASDFHDALLALLWRQWGQIGVAASVADGDGWCVDPEALLVTSMEVLRWEPRMFDEVLDWVDAHGGRLLRQRIGNMVPEPPAETARVVEAALARLPRPMAVRRATEARFADEGPPIPLFLGIPEAASSFGEPDPVFSRYGLLRPPYRRSGKATPLQLLRSSCFPFRLRELLGAGSRSEALRYLLLVAGNQATTSEVAEAVTLSRQNVHRALEGLAGAGVCVRLGSGSRDKWAVPRERWLAWLDVEAGSLPAWVDWPAVYPGLLMLWRWLRAPERADETPYIRSSRARRLMEEVAPRVAHRGLPWRAADPAVYPGESYLQVFEADVAKLASVLSGGARDS